MCVLKVQPGLMGRKKIDIGYRQQTGEEKEGWETLAPCEG